MDEQIRHEAATTDPDVPFRATTSHRHATWARTWHSRPELYVQPESLEEVVKTVNLARRCRRHIVTVGSGHSPSDLTCTSGWKVNLDRFNKVLSVNRETKVIVLEAGIRLYQIQEALREQGLALPNAGSIVEQSIAGAISTGTHGSSLKHGLLSDNVLALKIVTADGQVRSCSREKDQELFRAALVSLGALGIIVEVSFQAVDDFKVQWTQTLENLSWVLDRWGSGLWSDHEYVRVWWMPYMKKCIYWRADKTDGELMEPRKGGLLSGRIGFHIYQIALYISNWIPSLNPFIERMVGRIQYGASAAGGETGVQWARDGLQMDCLYSQFVNEWALPLERGPEALTRLSAWIHGDAATANIPYSSKGIYVHAPVEVRVSDGRVGAGPRAFLDPTSPTGPTLYLNATLYRPYHSDPPARAQYYRAFEHLMKELGGRPHWAKNFAASDLSGSYPDMDEWLLVRDETDPAGMFFGDWHRRNLLGASAPTVTDRRRVVMPLEERRAASSSNVTQGGRNFYGEIFGTVQTLPVAGKTMTASSSPPASDTSFELMDHGDAEMSVMIDSKFVGDE